MFDLVISVLLKNLRFKGLRNSYSLSTSPNVYPCVYAIGKLVVIFGSEEFYYLRFCFLRKCRRCKQSLDSAGQSPAPS